MMKPGSRLKSATCDSEVVVIRYNSGTIGCGGAAMSEAGGDAELDPALADGTLMGKRYVDDDNAEVLVTKAGAGTLSVGDRPLVLKEAKPLPASD